MQILIYKIKYNIEVSDWRLLAMQCLEKDIIGKSYTYKVWGMCPEEVAQELRLKMWITLPKYNPERSSVRTFSIRVMNNFIRDLNRKQMADKRKINNFVSCLEEDDDEDDEE